MKKKIIDTVKFLVYNCRRSLYTFMAKRQLKAFGEGLRVNHKCVFNRNVEVGNSCNFNGLWVSGGVKYL